MKRTFNQIKIDENTTRNVVVLYDDPCDAGTSLYQNRQLLFLQYLANDYRLTMPGDDIFQTLQISHNGVCWTATAVSVTTKTNTEK